MRLVIVLIWVSWFLVEGTPSAAQIFQTQAGTILVSGKYKGAGVTAVSNHLFVHLNYDKAELHMRLMIPSFSSTDDSLTKRIQHLEGYEFVFSGKMNIAFVQTKSHPKQKFSTSGMMQLNGVSKALRFNSVLEHFPRGNASCVLSGDFLINLAEFNVANLPPEEQQIWVRFNQIILKKPGE